MNVWQITKKDLRLLLRDRRALVILLALPLVFITIIGFSTGQLLNWKQQNRLLQIAVAGAETNPQAARLLDSLQQRPGFAVELVASRPAAEQLLNAEEVDVSVVVGDEFPQQVAALQPRDILDPSHGRLADGVAGLAIEVHGRSERSTAAELTRQLLFAEVLQVLGPRVLRRDPHLRRFLASGEQNPASNAEETRHAPSLASSRKDDASPINGGNVVYQEIVPSYTVLFVFFLVNIMGRSFIAERDLGTLRRLRIAPVPPSGLLVGKTLPFFLVSLAQTALLFVGGKLLFGMHWGEHPALLVPVIACTSLAATALGLLVATLVRTDSQVSAYGNFLVITMAGISGCFMQREWLPALLQRVSLVTPHAWSLIAFDQLLSEEAADLKRVFLSCGVLLGFSLLLFTLGCWRFRKT